MVLCGKNLLRCISEEKSGAVLQLAVGGEMLGVLGRFQSADRRMLLFHWFIISALF